MCTIAFGQVCFYIAYNWNDFTGGYDGLRGFHRAPIDFGLFTIDIAANGNAFYFFLLVVFALAVGLMGIAAALAVRPHHAGDPRERAPRPLPRHAGRAPHLAVVLDLLLLHRAGRHALCAAQQLRRSAGAALLVSGNIVIMTRDGRHAHLLGAAGRRRAVRDAAGLHLVDDHQLDVASSALIFVLVVLFFPRGLLGMRAAAERRHEHARGSQRHQELRQPGRGQRRVDGGRSGELRAIIGPNGAGKTTFFNLITGFFPPTAGDDPARRPETSRVPAPDRVKMGMGRTFQITEIFPELTVRENVRTRSRGRAGQRCACGPAGRCGARRSECVDEVMAPGQPVGQGRPAGRRAVARRSARHRDRHGAGAEAAPAAARRADRRHGRPGDLSDHRPDPPPAPRLRTTRSC